MKNRLAPFILRTVLLLSLSIPAATHAQITVTDSQTVQQLMAVFAGPGVTYLNAVLTCPQGASAKWQGSSNLGFDSGIVLTTGYAKTDTAASRLGVNGPQYYFPATSRSAPGDSDLTQVSGVPTFDACKLEFDFVPAYDSLFINYAFGSEEYDNFSCSPFNDAFAFFLSGPGITGKKNIAVIPGTSIAVSINSTTDPAVTFPSSLSQCQIMGPGSPFAQYYNDNSTGDNLTYYGLTKMLAAVAQVVPGSTYHMKLVVADGSDGTLDSGVFLKAGSLRTNVPVLPNNVAGIDFLSQLALFPNPTADGRMRVSYSLREGAAVAYSVTNAIGRRVYEKAAAHHTAGFHEDVLTLPKSLPAGPYFLHVISGATQKMVAFTIAAQ